MRACECVPFITRLCFRHLHLDRKPALVPTSPLSPLPSTPARFDLASILTRAHSAWHPQQYDQETGQRVAMSSGGAIVTAEGGWEAGGGWWGREEGERKGVYTTAGGGGRRLNCEVEREANAVRAKPNVSGAASAGCRGGAVLVKGLATALPHALSLPLPFPVAYACVPLAWLGLV